MFNAGFKPKPHVSAALRHLRFSVTALGVILVACVVLQILVWAFVHYTEARWSSLAPETPNQEPVVVHPAKSPDTTPLGSVASKHILKAPPAESSIAAPPDVNMVLSRNNRWFELITELAQTIGVVAAVTLAMVMMLGVVVAAGGSVPGVERAVTGATWSIAIAMLCLPLSDILHSLPYTGVFASYANLTAVSDAIRRGDPLAPSSFVFFCQHLIIPVSVVIAVAIIIVRFHSGVDQGVIATSVSELDEKLEKEITSIKLGATSAPRTIGALNRAIGEVDQLSELVSSSLTRGGKHAQTDAARAAAKAETGRGMTEPLPGDPMKRPI